MTHSIKTLLPTMAIKRSRFFGSYFVATSLLYASQGLAHMTNNSADAAVY